MTKPDISRVNEQLLTAAELGDAEALSKALSSGADINARDLDEWTPLMFAADNGDEKCLRTLLAAGADQNARDPDGWTPLMLAADIGDEECLRTLIAAGADENASDIDGWTPLMFAAISGHTQCVHLLLAAGADPDYCEPHFGGGAAHMANQKKHFEIAALIESYANALSEASAIDESVNNPANATTDQIPSGGRSDRWRPAI